MKSGICPKCAGSDIIVAEPPEYGHANMERPMTVTAKPRWIFPGRNCEEGIGTLHLYLCRDCGYAEWYVKDPMSIPVDPKYKTRRF